MRDIKLFRLNLPTQPHVTLTETGQPIVTCHPDAAAMQTRLADLLQMEQKS